VPAIAGEHTRDACTIHFEHTRSTLGFEGIQFVGKETEYLYACS
jgi:hypothetical protein